LRTTGLSQKPADFLNNSTKEFWFEQGDKRSCFSVEQFFGSDVSTGDQVTGLSIDCQN
jgi:hypothetical protein